MRVILEVANGPFAGRRVRLQEGETFQVGRSDWADLACAYDTQMSRLHFKVGTDSLAAYLTDLKSTNGTLINGEQVTRRAVLRHDDEIRAGDTKFFVRIEGDDAEKASIGFDPEKSGPLKKPAAPRSHSGLDDRAGVPYTFEATESGLRLYRGGLFGEAGEPEIPFDIAGRLATSYPLYLLADFRKLELPPPENRVAVEPLFDWLPPEVAWEQSPLIVAPGAAVDLEGLVNTAWDQDAVLCLFSDDGPDAVIHHLRTAARLNAKGYVETAERPAALCGYCWPSVFSHLLAFRDSDFAGRLMGCLDAALMEVPDLPLTWQIFAPVAFRDKLEAAGFVQRRDER